MVGHGHPPKARDLAAHLEGKDFKATVADLLDYAEASLAFKSGDVSKALPLAARLHPGAKRALLYLKLAAAEKKQDRAASLLNPAWKDSESSDPEAAPYLLLGVANAMLRVEPDSALAALSRAVKAFNDLDSDPHPNSGQRIFENSSGLNEIVVSGGSRVLFPLTIGFPLTVSNSIPSFARTQATRADAALRGLLNEERLAEALTALASARLADALKVLYRP